MASKKKKITTAIVAGVTAVALLLGGTFAWQSINQTALNEVDDVVNPGGRLHDDFNGSNKDVYVENFADENIFARIRLEEFFEITQAGGTVHKIAGSRDENGNVAEYVLHDFYNENATEAYWNWQTGGSTVFMPTFNKNKDSFVADINGTYNGKDGIVTNDANDDRYSDYVEYYFGQKLSGDAIYDYDSNDADEVGTDFNNLGAYSEHVTTVTEEHTAKNTLNATLISMDDWMGLAKEDQIGNYWVYDTDGWVYWAAPIAPGDATGLLLDGISLKDKMDDSWYYAINVIAQFVTKGDVGETDNTGFYDTTDGLSVPTKEAKKLLKIIGAFNEPKSVTVKSFTNVSFVDYNEPGVENVQFERNESQPITVSAGETINIKVDAPGWDELTEVTLIACSTEEAVGAPSTCTEETTMLFDEESQLIELSVSEKEIPGTAIYIRVSDGTNIGYIKVLLKEQSYSGDPYYYIYFEDNDPLNVAFSTDSVDFNGYLEPTVNVFVTPETESVSMYIKLMNGTPLNQYSVYYDSWNVNGMYDSDGNMIHRSAFQSVLDDGTRKLEIPWKDAGDPERNDGSVFYFYLRASGGRMLSGCHVRVIYVEDINALDYGISASGQAIPDTLASGSYPLALSKVVVNEYSESFATGVVASNVTWSVTGGNAAIDPATDMLTLPNAAYGEKVTLTAEFDGKTYEESFLVGENLVDLTEQSDYEFTEGKTYILKTASTETYGLQRDAATLTITYGNGQTETLKANSSGYFVWTPKNVWGVMITDNSTGTSYPALVRPEKYLEFASNETIKIGNNGPYIELQKNRTGDTKWNLWGCSEGDFTLSSSNTAVTFEPYSSGSENRDMYVVIPETVTENFTVTATAMNGNGSVTITVVMVDN